MMEQMYLAGQEAAWSERWRDGGRRWPRPVLQQVVKEVRRRLRSARLRRRSRLLEASAEVRGSWRCSSRNCWWLWRSCRGGRRAAGRLVHGAIGDLLGASQAWRRWLLGCGRILRRRCDICQSTAVAGCWLFEALLSICKAGFDNESRLMVCTPKTWWRAV